MDKALSAHCYIEYINDIGMKMKVSNFIIEWSLGARVNIFITLVRANTLVRDCQFKLMLIKYEGLLNFILCQLFINRMYLKWMHRVVESIFEFFEITNFLWLMVYK